MAPETMVVQVAANVSWKLKFDKINIINTSDYKPTNQKIVYKLGFNGCICQCIPGKTYADTYLMALR